MASEVGSSSEPLTSGCMKNVQERMAAAGRQDRRVEDAAPVAVAESSTDQQEQAERR